MPNQGRKTRSSSLLLLLFCLPSLLLAQASQEDDRTILNRGKRATFRFKLPESPSEWDMTTLFQDTTIFFYGGDWEVSITQEGRIFHSNANVNYESDTYELACGAGVNFQSTEFSEWVTNSILEVNQVAIKSCQYNACLTSGVQTRQQEDQFFFTLDFPFYTFEGKGPVAMKEELIQTLYSFSVYNFDPKLLEPYDRPLPTGAVAFGKGVLNEVVGITKQAGVIEDGQVEEMPDMESKEQSGIAIYQAESFEPDPDGVQPAIINYDLYEWLEGEEITDEVPPEISLEINGEVFDGNQLFYAEPGDLIKMTLKVIDREDPIVIEFVFPEGEHTDLPLDEIAGDADGVSDDEEAGEKKAPQVTVSTGQCACSGMLIFDINAVNRVPLDLGPIDKEISRLERICKVSTTDYFEREERKTYLKNLAAQVANLKLFVKQMMESHQELIDKNAGKLKDLKDAEEEYQAVRDRYSPLTGQAVSQQLIQLRDNIWAAERVERDLKFKARLYYEKLGDIQRALNSVGLPPGSDKAAIDKKLAELKTQLEENQHGLKRKALIQRKANLERLARETQEKIDNDPSITGEKFKETQTRLEGYWKELEEVHEALFELNKEATQLQYQIRDLSKVQSLYEELPALTTTVDAHKVAWLKVEELRDQYSLLQSQQSTADSYLEKVEELDQELKLEIELVEDFAEKLDSVKKEYEEKYVNKVVEFETRLTGIDASLQVDLKTELNQFIRAKESTRALKGALQTMQRYSSDEYWRFDSGRDGAKIAKSYIGGIISGMNPFEMVEMAQYAAYLAILTQVDEPAAKEEVNKLIEMGISGANQLIQMERFADQMEVIAAMVGNAKGEMAMVAALGKTGKTAKAAMDRHAAIMDSRKRAVDNIRLRKWPIQSRNPIINKLLFRVKKVEVDYWDEVHETFAKRIDNAVDNKKISKEAGEALKEALGPVDLQRLGQDHLAEEGMYHVLKKMEQRFLDDQQLKLSQGIKPGKEPIYWQTFYALKDVDPDLAGRMDQLRDKIIYDHLAKARAVPHGTPDLKFAAGYSGSADGVTPHYPDFTKIKGDRDLLFLGTDAPKAMARFIKSIERDWGPSWGRLFDSDAYLDSQFDNIGRLELHRPEIPNSIKREANDLLTEHRRILNEKLQARHDAYEAGVQKELVTELTADQLNEKLYEMQRHLSMWKSSRSTDDLAKYLELNREYFLAQKDAYLTPGSRTLEIGYRMDWAANYGLSNGADWAAYIKQLNSRSLKKQWRNIPLATHRDGLENIIENRAQAYNKRRYLKGKEAEIAHETAKYYERAIRTGVLVKPQVDLSQLTVRGRTVEELRQVAMKIKEGKALESTKALISDYYGVAPDKITDQIFKDFQADCEAAAKMVENMMIP